MADLSARIKPKKSSTASEVPQAADLEVAELAVNTADGTLFTKHTDGSVVAISGGGGGGSSTLRGLTDTDIPAPSPSSLFFTSFNGGQTTFTDPASSATGGSIDTSLGTNAWKVLSTDYYGDGSKLEGVLDTDGRYDVVNFRVRSANNFSTNNRVSLGGTKQEIGSGGGFTIYSRNTGFGFYANGAFQEIGTLPTMNADTWYEITWVADWGSVQRATQPTISLWVDGAIAINNVATTGVSYTELTGADANDFRLMWNDSAQTNSGDKFYDDFRIQTSSTLPWGMTDATITNPAALMDSAYGASSNITDGNVLTWNNTSSAWVPADPVTPVTSVNTQTGAVSLGVQDMNDYGLNPTGGATYTYASTSNSSPSAGVANIWTGAFWAINVVDNEGTDWESSLYDTGLFVNGINTVVIVNGSTVATTTTTSIGNRNTNRITFTFADTSWHASLVDGDEIVFQWTGFPTGYTALANGDILQWNNTESEFRPAEFALDGLADATYSGGTLTIDGLGSIEFARYVPAGETWRIYDNSVYGLVLTAFEDATSDGSFFFVHPTKGVEIKMEETAVFNISGPYGATTNTPEIRLNTGNPTDTTPTGNYFGLTLPAGYSADQTYTVPATDGTSGQMLSTDGAGALSWASLQGAAVRAALGIGEYADDAAAGTGGVASGALYYNTTSSDYRLKT